MHADDPVYCLDAAEHRGRLLRSKGGIALAFGRLHCTICGTGYRYDNLYDCTECGVIYCYDCVHRLRADVDAASQLTTHRCVCGGIVT